MVPNLCHWNIIQEEDIPLINLDTKKNDIIFTIKRKLDDSDIAETAKKVGEKTFPEKIITITKGYDNRIRVSDNIDEQELVNHLISTTKLNPYEIARVTNTKTILELRNKLTGAPRLASPQNQLLSTVQSLSPDGLLSTVYNNIA